jgi:uncharacterized protein VirK/YbjX
LRACAISAKNVLRRCRRALRFARSNFDESIFAVIAGHREIVHLMRQPGLRALMSDLPPMVYRCYHMYMATSFTKKARRAVLIEHYLYLLNRVNTTFFIEILENQPRLWQKTIGRTPCRCIICPTASRQDS